MVLYFLTSGHRFNKPQQPTKDYLVSWSSYRRQRPQYESVALKVIKGEISVLSNTLCVQVGSSTRNYLGATLPNVD
mgnify:FL=1